MTTDDSFDPFAGGTIARTAPVTEPQREIWLAVELGGREANLAYNESTSLCITGPVDEAVLTASFYDTVRRHEALRSTLSADGSTLLVEEDLRTRLEREDWSKLDADARAARQAEFHRACVETPFDLAQGPLFRATLLKLDAAAYELVLVAHHVICDGWSFGVLCEEITQAYQDRVQGTGAALPDAPRYTDYAVARIAAMTGADAEATERYWLELLGRQPPVLDLPTDRPRPRERTFDAARRDYNWSGELCDGLRQVGRRAGASFVAVSLALVNTLFHRWTGQDDFVVGLAAAGQMDEGWGGLVGHCVNTLPVRVRLDPRAPFADQVRYARGAILDAFDHQHASFGSLLEKLELPRDPSRVPLVPVLFNLDPLLRPLQLGAATGEMVGNPRSFEAFEVFFNLTELASGLRLEITYNTNLFDAETVDAWFEQLTALAHSAVADATMPLGALRCHSDAARARILALGNDTAVEVPKVTAATLIERWAEQTPDAIAVRDANTVLTYRELDRQANRLAARLRDLGVREESLVGLCVERSARMVVALLAIWKAGGAYVPLDPDFPVRRLEQIVEDAGFSVMVTQRSLSDVLAQRTLSRVWLDDELGASAERLPRDDSPDRLAYVLHTSGSTGQPKGVAIEHGALVNFLLSMQREPGFSARDVIVAVTTLSFDIAGLELYLPLVSGGQTVVASREDALDGARLSALLLNSGATVFQATPATFRLLLEAEFPGSPGLTVLCGGEAFPRDLATELRARCGRVWNMYGPTETTIWSTCTPIDSDDGTISIGRPIANTTAYVVDELGEPVPVGALGELLLGGLGVARGYLGRPDLTAERFIPDPFSRRAGARLYRTGDVVRQTRDGQLFFERRRDTQVKVRGFRIELGDIEAALASHPGVAAACAAVREFGPGDTRLIGYLVPREGATPGRAELRTHLQGQLPPYMIPQHFVELAALPLAPNGKLDRKALPAPDDDGAADDRYVAPVTATQQTLAAIWCELLRVHRVGIRDPFFEIGGHSMLAVRMLSRIRESLGVEVPLRTAFQAQTIEDLSAHLEAALILRRRAPAAAGADLDEAEF
jgi:amino acid adenylation domain-containing protein